MKIPIEIEQYRVTDGTYASKSGDPFGMFDLKITKGSFRRMCVIVSPFTDDWQHVSVSLKDRTPMWDEMCMVKNLFWDESETVVQYHPAKSEYVNNHPYCLHLWRPQHVQVPVPPSILIGIKDAGHNENN